MNTASRPILLVVAAPAEAMAVARAFPGSAVPSEPWMVGRLSARFRLMLSGVGQANAAGATASALRAGAYQGVVSIGIAGALPGSSLRLGQGVLASASVFSDEGILTPEGFQTCAQMGFPLGRFEGNTVPADTALLELLSPIFGARGGLVGPVATVSTCSGTDSRAREVAARTGAMAEAMEGAAVGLAASRFSDRFPRRTVAFAEVRAISNTTGDRAAQRWDIKRALGEVTDMVAAIAGALGAVRKP